MSLPLRYKERLRIIRVSAGDCDDAIRLDKLVGNLPFRTIDCVFRKAMMQEIEMSDGGTVGVRHFWFWGIDERSG